MWAYLKKFWAVLSVGLLFGVALAILIGIPWQFTLALAVFVFVLNTIIEQVRSGGAVIDATKKLFTFAVGITVFVGFRAVIGYLMDTPADQAYKDLTLGNGLSGIPWRRVSVNIVFELLLLIPALTIAYKVAKKAKGWRSTFVVVCTLLLVWVAWTMKQAPHAQAMKRLTQARISLDARGRNNHALLNEAAAASSFGVAKEPIGVFYQWNTTTSNMVKNLAITNRLQVGDQVLQPNPDKPPQFFEGLYFTEVVLKGQDGSFLGGTKIWVETRQFSWVDGGNANVAQTAPATASTFTVNKGERKATVSHPDRTTVHFEANKAFTILERNGTNPDGSFILAPINMPAGKSQRYFAWGGSPYIEGLYDGTQITVSY